MDSASDNPKVLLPDEPSPPDQTVTAQPEVQNPERFTGHQVQLKLFEGPLDLLLYLIRRHKYDIFDIPIHTVTEQFLEYLQLMEEVDIEYAGDFLVTSATLLQIKSRMLLPKPATDDDDEDDDDDPRKELVERLLEYQRLQGAAESLAELREERSRQFVRPPVPTKQLTLNGTDVLPLQLQEASSFDLLRALQRVLERVEQRPVATIRREPFSLADRSRFVQNRLRSSGEEITFGALCDDCESRMEVVITFIAVLELIRRNRAKIRQTTNFEEIFIWATSYT